MEHFQIDNKNLKNNNWFNRDNESKANYKSIWIKKIIVYVLRCDNGIVIIEKIFS